MILPVAAGCALAISFFQIKLSVEDKTYTTVNGQDTLAPTASRQIDAAVDPSRSRQMERLFGGSVSDGDIGIYTKAVLYFTDQYAEGEAQRQSFVTYQGIRYRVEEVADWTPQAGLRVYLAKRHVVPGG